jgi:hypothetical protein
MYEVPAPQPQAQANSGGGYRGKSGGGRKEYDPRATEKDYLMAAMNGWSTAATLVQLEVAARTAAGGVFSEAEVLQRATAVMEQVYESIKKRRADMQRPGGTGAATGVATTTATAPAPVPASLAQQAPPAPQAAPAPAYQPPQTQAAPPAPQTAPVYQPPQSAVTPGLPVAGATPYDRFPYADHLVPFGRHATVDGQKGVPHITIAELAAGIDPGYLHWAAKKAPAGKYTDALTRAGNQGTCPSFQERVIHFLNGAEQAGTPVPNPEYTG